MLAMHMANELLTPPVAGVLMLLAGAVVAMACWRLSREMDPAKVPLMGVMGAFVFAGQMINFPILPGTSGHLVGSMLLAILLGPHATCVVMASILIVQCLVFQDGGLLALGANILNIGIIPAYVGYGFFRLLRGDAPRAPRLYAAVFAATMISVLAGAAAVPFEVWMSGVLSVPLPKFLAVMIGLHALVGLGEAVITFLVVGYIVRLRPRLLGQAGEHLAPAEQGLSTTGLLVSLAVVALLMGGVVALWASGSPDALESLTAREGFIQGSEHPLVDRLSTWQEETAPLPDYQVPGRSEALGTSISGLVGTAFMLCLLWLLARWLRPRTARHAHPHPH